MPELRQEYLDILEKREWSVSGYTDDGRVELEWWSPAGEDFLVCVNVENFPDEILDYSDDFDPDEHIEMWVEARACGLRRGRTADRMFRAHVGLPKTQRTSKKNLTSSHLNYRRQKENYGLQVLQHPPPTDGGRHPVPETTRREHNHNRQLRGGPDVLQGHRPARVGIHRIHRTARPAAGLGLRACAGSAGGRP